MANDLNEIVRAIARLSASDQELLAGIVVGSINRPRSQNEQPDQRAASTQEDELHDLTEALRNIAEKLPNSEQREVVQQAALGLSLLQSVGLWPLFQRWWRERDEELSEEQRAHLRSLGGNPDG
jgi:hypothetical protein